MVKSKPIEIHGNFAIAISGILTETWAFNSSLVQPKTLMRSPLAACEQSNNTCTFSKLKNNLNLSAEDIEC